MVGPHHASVALWFTISTIIDQRRERDTRNTVFFSSKRTLAVNVRAVANGLTIAVLAQSLSAGLSPLSGGGWNDRNSATYLDS